MSEMFPDSIKDLILNEEGAGLMVALFVIVILGTYGTLIAKYASIGAVTSVEEYLWAQSLYSAESAVQLRILAHDKGGKDGPEFPITIEQFHIEETTEDTNVRRGVPATIKMKASRLQVSREIELTYLL